MGSKFLAKVIGIYLVIVSLALFTNLSQFRDIVNQMLGNAPLMLITGFFTLILGIMMVVSHNIWEWNWRLIITILAWIVFLKGFSIIFFPEYLDKISVAFMENNTFAYIAAVIDLILGLILCYFGFRSYTADAAAEKNLR